MCCGSIERPMKPSGEPTQSNRGAVNSTITTPPQDYVPDPLVTDNINMQRAAQVRRDNYHKNRFQNGG